MAITVEVKNNHDGVIGRAGYRFDPGKTKTVVVTSSRLDELTNAPMLDTNIVSADSAGELPPGVSVKANATPEAEEYARSRGVDIFAIEGSGKGGRVLKEDVDKVLAEGAGNTNDAEHWRALHLAGGGDEKVTTLDPVDEQIAAAHRAQEELERMDEGVHGRDVAAQEAEVVAPEQDAPDQSAASSLPGAPDSSANRESGSAIPRGEESGVNPS